jgi:hypothetical protein
MHSLLRLSHPERGHYKVHTTLVKFYQDASLEVTEELISFLEY